ncbi:hypothetical protein Taro_020123 [Colocasia esculenta]|uniref:Uncharacterized protein n=1 Tax=Colocasia esculenta TaxID=4460 RepID=A0A843UYR5_COLES|nr:hypothetical protein [Colocasia esculenta]
MYTCAEATTCSGARSAEATSHKSYDVYACRSDHVLGSSECRSDLAQELRCIRVPKRPRLQELYRTSINLKTTMMKQCFLEDFRESLLRRSMDPIDTSRRIRRARNQHAMNASSQDTLKLNVQNSKEKIRLTSMRKRRRK